MEIALQFVAALLVLGAVIALGGAVGNGIEGALGEKTLRDRSSED